MRVQKAELAQKINKIKSVVPKKTALPALQGILIKDGYLIANNTELSIKVKLDSAGEESFIIPLRAFDLINNLPDGEIEIIPKGNVIIIKTNKIKNQYQSMGAEMFSAMDVKNDGTEFVIESERLLEAIKKVLYAISTKGVNPVMTALCMQADKGILNFVGLDGHMIAWDQITYDGKFELLIPKSTAEKLISLDLSGSVSIKYNKFGALFTTDEYAICTRVIDGEYFHYQKMFKELSTHISVVRKELLEAMTRAKLCMEDRVPVKFDISGETLNISLKGSTTDYSEIIGLNGYVQEKLIIGFDARLIIETLKVFSCENIQIHLENPKSPIIIEGERKFKAMVLPVAIA